MKSVFIMSRDHTSKTVFDLGIAVASAGACNHNDQTRRSVDSYQKRNSARRIAIKEHQQEAKSTFKSIKSLIASSNRHVQLCRNNKSAGLEAKQLKKIVWRMKEVSINLLVMGLLILGSLIVMHEGVSVRKLSESSAVAHCATPSASKSHIPVASIL